MKYTKEDLIKALELVFECIDSTLGHGGFDVDMTLNVLRRKRNDDQDLYRYIAARNLEYIRTSNEMLDEEYQAGNKGTKRIAGIVLANSKLTNVCTIVEALILQPYEDLLPIKEEVKKEKKSKI